MWYENLTDIKDWLHIEYSNKQVTAFGGMLLVKRFLDKTGLVDFISTPDLPVPGDPMQAIHLLLLSHPFGCVYDSLLTVSHL